MVGGKIALLLLVALVVFGGGVAGLGFILRQEFILPVSVIQNFEDSEVSPESAEVVIDHKLTAALKKGDAALAKQLIREQRTGEDTRPHDWSAALAIAAPLKDKELVKIIEEQGASPCDALNYVSSAKEAEAVVHLGAKVQNHVSDTDCLSHLGRRALDGDAEMVEWFLEHGAKANEKYSGQTLLSYVEDERAMHPSDVDKVARLTKVISALKARGATQK